MGYGSYSRDAYRAITTRRRTETTDQVFSQRILHPQMDPKGVTFRESRDSDTHPESIGIIFALDETGSMGHIPDMLARDHLPKFMETILDGNVVKDPQIMIMGIGDATTGEASPLQVGQFESEAELMDQWLTYLHLVGQGGGNVGESYDLAFYFAARHTALDCFEKRGKKGYLFITGDEPHLGLTFARTARDLIDDGLQEDVTVRQSITEASRMYHCFFLIPDPGRARNCEPAWRPDLGDRVIVLAKPEDTCLACATIIGLTEGTLPDLEAARRNLVQTGTPAAQADRIIKALRRYDQNIAAGLRAAAAAGETAGPTTGGRTDPDEPGGGADADGGGATEPKPKSDRKPGRKAKRPV